MNALLRPKTVTVELPYEDALRLWVIVHDPANAGTGRADDRIRKIVSDAIKVTEDDYDKPAEEFGAEMEVA